MQKKLEADTAEAKALRAAGKGADDPSMVWLRRRLFGRNEEASYEY